MAIHASTHDIHNLDDFDAAWRQTDEQLRTLIRVVYGLIGLTRLGAHPVEVDRFAAYLDRPADEATRLLADNSGALFTTQVRDGLITLDLARLEALRRRHIRLGQRRIAMSGCAPDLFQIAAVIDIPFQVEDTCPATGVPIRVDFTPPDRSVDLVDTVAPADTVVALDPRLLGQNLDHDTRTDRHHPVRPDAVLRQHRRRTRVAGRSPRAPGMPGPQHAPTGRHRLRARRHPPVGHRPPGIDRAEEKFA